MKRLFGFSVSTISIFLLLGSIFTPGFHASASPAQVPLLATRTITTLVDENTTCTEGGCSLREAIAEAAPGDTISFGSLDGTITLTNGQLTINKNLSISGPTAAGQSITVDANNLSRVFEITTNGTTVTISNITIRGGNSTIGGGIRNTCNTCTLNINGVTFTDNVSTNHKTGSAVHSSGILNLTNSTISGNSSTRNNTSSICNDHGTMYIIASTISNNLNIPNNGAALVSNGATYVRNSIIANSETSPDCETSGGGSLTTQGYNFIRNLGTACTITGDQSNDHNGSVGVLGPDPQISPLQNNGGSTLTHSPLWNSPAKDIIPFANGTCNSAPATDQRGQSRPQPAGGMCDSGSLEVTIPIVTFTPGETSFPELGDPVLIDPGVTVQDTDSPDFNGGTLSVQVVSGSSSELLSVKTDLVITVSGSNVYYNGTLIATILGNSSDSLTFDLLAGATPANTQVLLRHITYQNTLHNPPSTQQIEAVLNDGDGSVSAPAYKTIGIITSNEAPALQAILSQSIPEAAAFTFTAVGTDPDLPYDTLTYSLDAGYPAGASINAATGVFSWTPTESQGPAVYPLAVRVADSGELYATDSFTLTVTEVNQLPVLSPIGPKSTDELVAISFTASASDADIPANTLTFGLSGAPSGASIGSATGYFSWTPTEAQGPNSYTFDVTVSDGTGTVTTPVTINVSEVNTAPVLDEIPDVTLSEETLLAFTAAAEDTDLPANTLTYSLGGVPAGASINPSTGAFSWTPTEEQGPGTYIITVQVSDGTSTDTQSFTAVVNEVNQAPVIFTISDQAIAEGYPFSMMVIAADADVPTNTLTYALVDPPLGGAIDPVTGEFTWTPAPEQGPASYFITVTATDNGTPNLTSELVFYVEVTETNNPPVLDPVGNKSVNEGSLLAFTVTAHDNDIPANVLSFGLENAPDGAAIDPVTGEFTWTPAEDQGPHTHIFTILVIDDGEPFLTDSETIHVTVNEVNAAPVLTPIGSRTAAEGNLLTFTVGAADADLPANILAYSLINAPAGASILPSTGVFTWTPAETQGPGAYSFTFRVTDNGTPVLFDEETITVTVTEVNLPPVLDLPVSLTVDEGSLAEFTATASDPDLPATSLSFSLVNAPSGATIDPTTGAFSWATSEGDGPASYPITVRVTDNGMPQLHTDLTVTITVNEVNTAPTLDPIGSWVIDELEHMTFTATASDLDLPENSFTYSLSGAPAAASIDPATGLFDWLPSETDGPGTYTFTVLVTDNGIPNLFAEESIVVQVNEVNSKPSLDPISDRTVAEGTELTFTASTTDADIPANSFSYSITGEPGGAVIDPYTGVFSWTPSESRGPGIYTFTVWVLDNGVTPLGDSQIVHINVLETNQAPVLEAVADQTAAEDQLLSLNMIASDPDLPVNSLTFALQDAPAGAAIDPSSGLFTWTPGQGQGPATYAITVTVTDNGMPAMMDWTVFQVTVVTTNNAPVLAAIPDQSVDEENLLSFTAAAADTDIPADILTFSLTGGSSSASIDPVTGEFTWTPSEAEGPGAYNFTITVTDNGSPVLSDWQTFQVTVGEVNQAPVLAAVGNLSVNEGSLLTFTASASDVDLPTNSLTFSLQNTPAGASIDPSSGVFAWTPSEAQGPQDYTVTIVVMDDGTPALTDQETITISVAEVNTAPVLDAVADVNTTEGSAVDFTLTASDADLPANLLTFDLQEIPAGSVFDPATGVFHWVPGESQGPATYVLTATVTDSGSPALSDSDVFSIIVGELNQAPVLSPIPDQSTPEMQLLTFTAAAADADLPANSLTYSLTGAPAGASIDAATGVFTWTPSETQGPGSYTLTVWVHDDGDPQMDDSQVVNITVSEVNLPPVLEPVQDQSVDEGTLLSLTAAAADPDVPSQTLTFSLVNPPAGASINPSTGAFTWTPTEAQGPSDFIITVQVSDGTLTDSEDFVVTVNEVNQAPTISPITDKSVDEGVLLAFTAAASDPDIPANSLAFSLGAGAPDGAAIDPSTGEFSWTPSEAQGHGSYTITVRVTDNGSPAMSASVDVNVEVMEVNSAPVLDPVEDMAIRVGTPLAFTAAASDPDLPANTLTFTLVNDVPAGAAIDPVTGEFTWTPLSPGTFTLTIRVTDSGSPELFDEVTFQVVVSPWILILPMIMR